MTNQVSSQKIGRRFFIGSMLSLPFATKSMAKTHHRNLSFYHTHTGENLSIDYHNGHTFIRPALEEINNLLSDFRTGDVHPIDTRLLDTLFLLQQKAKTNKQFEIISAYRSPKTNNLLRGKSKKVAKRSLHMQGKAIDIRLRGFDTKELQHLAKSLKTGGVGYYKRSDFLHIDTGHVRYW